MDKEKLRRLLLAVLSGVLCVLTWKLPEPIKGPLFFPSTALIFTFLIWWPFVDAPLRSWRLPWSWARATGMVLYAMILYAFFHLLAMAGYGPPLTWLMGVVGFDPGTSEYTFSVRCALSGFFGALGIGLGSRFLVALKMSKKGWLALVLVGVIGGALIGWGMHFIGTDQEVLYSKKFRFLFLGFVTWQTGVCASLLFYSSRVPPKQSKG